MIQPSSCTRRILRAPYDRFTSDYPQMPWHRYRRIWGTLDGRRELVVEPVARHLLRVALTSPVRDIPVGTVLRHRLPWWEATRAVTRRGRTRLGIRDFEVVRIPGEIGRQRDVA